MAFIISMNIFNGDRIHTRSFKTKKAKHRYIDIVILSVKNKGLSQKVGLFHLEIRLA